MNEDEIKKLLDGMDAATLELLIAQAATRQQRIAEDDARRQRWERLQHVILADHRDSLPGVTLYDDVFAAFEALPCPEDDAAIDAWQAFSGEVPAELPSLENDNLQMWREHLAEFQARIFPPAAGEDPPPDAGPEEEVAEEVVAEEVVVEEPEEDTPELPGPRTLDGEDLLQKLPGILDEMRTGSPLAAVRLGVDFGTSRSKILARSTLDESVVGAMFRGKDDCMPSALALAREGGGLRFGKAAEDAWLKDPGAWLYQRSLKRVLLDGRVAGISKVDRQLTTGHAAVFTFAGLMSATAARLIEAGVPADGGPWLPVNLATPVIHPYRELRPFWGSVMSKKVNYPTYLRYLTVAGSALAVALEGQELESWEPLLGAYHWLRNHLRETTRHLNRTGQFADVSEPMAAIADFTTRELGAGLHLVIDSGAGTTDWELIAVSESASRSLARDSMPFGGDDVDHAMLTVARDSGVFPEEASAWEDYVLHQLSLLKPTLFSQGYEEYNPLGLPGITKAQPIDLSRDEVLDVLKPRQREITERLRQTFRRGQQSRSEGWDNLERLGLNPGALDQLSHVWLLGGNASSPVLRSAIEAFLAKLNHTAPIDDLPLPLSEEAVGRTSLSRFRLAAVATGASRADHPDPGAVQRDRAMPAGVGQHDKDY